MPKIEIRFLSNSSWINAYKNNQSVYSKLFRFFNFGYAKKLMIINSRAYDLFCKNKFTLSEKYIVLTALEWASKVYNIVSVLESQIFIILS